MEAGARTAELQQPLILPWRRFVALGDSVTEGLGDPVEGYPTAGWVEQVGRRLGEGRDDYTFTNLGERFLTTEQIKERQLEPALALRPDFASVVVGGNDLLKETFDADGVRRDLEQIVVALHGVGATVFTCTLLNMTITPLLPPEANEFLRPRLEELRAVVVDVAMSHDLLFIDFWSEPMSADASIYSRDLQHANMKGHHLIARRTIRYLEQVVLHMRQPRASARG